MCSNIEQLVLWKRLSAESEKLKWISMIFPKMKYFAYHLDEELKVNDELKSFFQRNKTIEKFSLLSSNIQTVRECVENGIEINELFFKNTDVNLKENLTILKEFCGEDRSKRLHIHLYSDYIRMAENESLELFTSLKPNIDGLYFSNKDYFEDELMDAIKTFHELKVIQVTPTHRTFVLFLVANLPLLEEVYIYDNLYGNEVGVDVHWFSKQAEIVSSLISQSRKLKKLFIWQNNKNLLFEDYDKQRQLLDGAEKLTVFIDVNTLFKSFFKDIWTVDTFDVIFTESKHIRNPLVKNFVKRSF